MKKAKSGKLRPHAGHLPHHKVFPGGIEPEAVAVMERGQALLYDRQTRCVCGVSFSQLEQSVVEDVTASRSGQFRQPSVDLPELQLSLILVKFIASSFKISLTLS